ncbi:MAG TPA: hypothetical protein VIG08_14860 [Gemmatimonadales bacterium]|jgi:hypothetical protein
MRRLLAILACAVPTVSACHKNKPPVVIPAAAPAPTPAPPPPAEHLIGIDQDARLYYDDVPSFPDSIRQVIRDAESLSSVWAQATKGQASAPPLPYVDFSRSIVLLVGAGKLRSGDQIHVDSVGTRDGRLVAVVRTTVDCHSIPTAAYPFEIVRVKRSDRAVSFVERRSKAPDCE